MRLFYDISCTRAVTVLLLLPIPVQLLWAHDTVVVHPIITDQAITLVQSDDPLAAYAELYAEKEGGVTDLSYKRVYWGNNPNLEEGPAVNETDPEFEQFRKPRRSVLDGVVMEDSPSYSVVLRHFYHAYTGSRLDIAYTSGFVLSSYGEPISSKVAAVRFFDQSVELFGYESEELESMDEEQKIRRNSLAFWLFGHSLHHVEDMNSIGHVSNDAHLTIDPATFGERDDFEGHYLPTMIWEGDSDIVNLFGKKLPPRIVDEFHDIWPEPINAAGVNFHNANLETDSLARSVYNYAIFQGELEYPVQTCGPFACTPMTPPEEICGRGEIRGMFTNPDVDGEEGCDLRWDGNELLDYAHWNIKGVGDWQYQNSSSWKNDWWEATVFGGPENYFYIEQSMAGVGRGTCEDVDDDECVPFDAANLVIPYKARQDFGKGYNPNDPSDNPMVLNSKPLAQLEAESIIPLGAPYAAGYTQWWYQIVNTPPYLKSVEASQEGVTLYSAQWKDEIETRNVTLVAERKLPDSAVLPGMIMDQTQETRYVHRRDLEIDASVEGKPYVLPEKQLIIRLHFNEPIIEPDPMDAGSGFELRIGDHLVTSWEHKSVERDPESPLPAGKWFEGRSWELIIPASELAGLNGKVALSIKSKDLNLHWVGYDEAGNALPLEEGIGLDEDPSTPARRQRRHSDRARENYTSGSWWHYPWHTEDSWDSNYRKMEVGDFAYDSSGDGDQNHYLIFDNEKPQTQRMDGSIQDPPDA